MPQGGLAIKIGGGQAIGSTTRLGQSGGATIAQTAYGAGSAPVQKGRGVEHYQVFIGVQVAAVAWLAFLRWSLPSGSRREN